MSTIGVVHHNEDIHNIIKEPTPPILKSPRYKSKHSDALKQSHQKRLGPKGRPTGHDTFGYAHYELDPPEDYLKKGKRIVYRPDIDHKEYECKLPHRRPGIPKWKFECPKGTAKDFVRENIKWADSLETKEPTPKTVDSPRGNVQDLAHIIENHKIRSSEKYGQIPKYLCQRRKGWAQEKENMRKKQDAIQNYKDKMGIGTRGMGESVYMIDKETRAKLLEGLKENWAELSRQFLGLPVICDTWPKIKRKMWLEKEIDQIEKDVKLVETHPYIYLERGDRRRYSEIVEEIAKHEKEFQFKDEKMKNETRKLEDLGRECQKLDPATEENEPIQKVEPCEKLEPSQQQEQGNEKAE